MSTSVRDSRGEYPADRADRGAVLTKALLNAGKAMGLSQAHIGSIIGKERTALHRGLNPDSKSGELALLLIRVYRDLYVLMGGKPADIRHWVKTGNLHTGGIPAEQMKTVQGLNRVLEYLDAMRGRL
ncbi:MAG: XRE family transcriptional regulator [Gammaproteobacteria bacterium]|nr:MAG: XRE family transcriptional regulator [Gammaproteobacteria bacterium]